MKKTLCLILTINSLLFAEFTRFDGVIIDSKTDLMWQDKYAVDEVYGDDEFIPNIEYSSWFESIEYCKKLTLAGYSDWRQPTLKELNGLVEHDRIYPQIMIHPTFQFIASSELTGYWTSTGRKHFPGLAMRVNFFDGKEYIGVKTVKFYTRCVRQK